MNTNLHATYRKVSCLGGHLVAHLHYLLTALALPIPL